QTEPCVYLNIHSYVNATMVAMDLGIVLSCRVGVRSFQFTFLTALITYAISYMSMKVTYLFFFKAEDGIRDPLVTGVQTCALPISRRLRAAPRHDAMVGRPQRAGQRAAVFHRHIVRQRQHAVVGDGQKFLESSGRGKSRPPPEVEAEILLPGLAAGAVPAGPVVVHDDAIAEAGARRGADSGNLAGNLVRRDMRYR